MADTPPEETFPEYERLVREADGKYEPFPSFAEWQSLQVDEALWKAHLKNLRDLGSDTPNRLARARAVAKRAAAIETGAIEGLYDLDRGRTITIAVQGAMWEAAFAKEDARVRALIEAQLDAYDFVIDFATTAVPLAEAWIRELHARLCAAQQTYRALTPLGFQDQPLAHGKYKTAPNHVRLDDGGLYSYAPVRETAPEMGRLIAEMRSAAFGEAHPALQAAYAHYALVRIHPFQDGNGRVARALGSVFLYRAASIPFLVLVAHRESYLEALRTADKGAPQEFVTFVVQRSADAFLLVAESLLAADVPDPATEVEQIRSRYRTRGGFTHHQVDVAGQSLLSAVTQEFERQREGVEIANTISVKIETIPGSYPGPVDGYRGPVGIPIQTMRLTLTSAGPANAEVIRQYIFNLPRDCGPTDEIIVRCLENGTQLRTPINNIMTQERAVMDLQVAMFVQRALGEALHELSQKGDATLRKQGY